MTIASHCRDLLLANGPMTRDELGESCRAAGVTAARDPGLSVQSALSWGDDGRFVRVEGRYHLVESLAEGRWLAFERPTDDQFSPYTDLGLLRGLARRDGIPLATGGRLVAQPYAGSWTAPGGWLPSGDGPLAIRLTDGVGTVTEVELDAAARERGDDVVRRVEERLPAHSFDRRSRVPEVLAGLLVEDDGLLREPVPPLSELFPAPPAPRPSWPDGALVPLQLPPGLHDLLAGAARDSGLPLSRWIAEQLANLASWPSVHDGLEQAYAPAARAWPPEPEGFRWNPGLDDYGPDVHPLDRYRR